VVSDEKARFRVLRLKSIDIPHFPPQIVFSHSDRFPPLFRIPSSLRPPKDQVRSGQTGPSNLTRGQRRQGGEGKAKKSST